MNGLFASSLALFDHFGYCLSFCSTLYYVTATLITYFVYFFFHSDLLVSSMVCNTATIGSTWRQFGVAGTTEDVKIVIDALYGKGCWHVLLTDS